MFREENPIKTTIQFTRVNRWNIPRWNNPFNRKKSNSQSLSGSGHPDDGEMVASMEASFQLRHRTAGVCGEGVHGRNGSKCGASNIFAEHTEFWAIHNYPSKPITGYIYTYILYIHTYIYNYIYNYLYCAYTLETRWLLRMIWLIKSHKIGGEHSTLCFWPQDSKWMPFIPVIPQHWESTSLIDRPFSLMINTPSKSCWTYSWTGVPWTDGRGIYWSWEGILY